jgi:hypothetical protein
MKRNLITSLEGFVNENRSDSLKGLESYKETLLGSCIKTYCFKDSYDMKHWYDNMFAYIKKCYDKKDNNRKQFTPELYYKKLTKLKKEIDDNYIDYNSNDVNEIKKTYETIYKQYSVDTVVTHNNFNEFVEMYDATVKYISNLLSKKHIPDKEETISKIKTIIV